MKIAALDLGSNTFLCLIAEVEAGAITRIYADETEMVRLGQQLEANRHLHPEALQRADACLERYSRLIKEHKPQRVLAMATSAARDAVNKHELFAIAAKHGIPLEIIPGDKEAEITYQGAVSALKDENKNILVLDIGGGSTEFVFGHEKNLLIGKSFDIGCVRLSERFITNQPTPVKEVLAATAYIDSQLQAALELTPKDFKLDQIIAVAGTPTSLVVAELGFFDPALIDGFALDRAKLNDWFFRLSKATVDEKINMGIPKGRADVILVGVIILLRALNLFGLQQITVSTRGVRYGVALEAARRA